MAEEARPIRERTVRAISRELSLSNGGTVRTFRHSGAKGDQVEVEVILEIQNDNNAVIARFSEEDVLDVYELLKLALDKSDE